MTIVPDRQHPPTLDPELVEVAGVLASRQPAAFARVREQALTQLAARLARDELPPVEAVDLSAPGDPPVPVRLFRPRRRPRELPVFVWIHGGGFTAGSAEALDSFCAEIAARLDIAVANVEYRLAPGTPFPGPFHDCRAALVHVYRQARQLGLDEARIGIGGASSGAALAAATALWARDEGQVPLAFQLLDVPILDDRLTTWSMLQFVDTPGFTRGGATAAWTAYLGPRLRPGDSDVSPYAAPARSADLAGLPSTYLATMELDPARDEGVLFALRLLAAGVSVELHSFPGAFHGSEIFAPFSAVSLRAAEERLRALARGLSVEPDRRVRLT
jgi:acetyl esterase/lipase